jgi:hypothetical protein
LRIWLTATPKGAYITGGIGGTRTMLEYREWRFPNSETRQAMTTSGPWDEEVDKVQWQDPATGLPCLINRGPSGSLCGYVGVDMKHPFYGVSYNQECADCHDREDDGTYHYCEHKPESMLNVHGGLTYSGFCNPAEGDQGICHIVEEGEDDKIYWHGFDTAHGGDLCPGHMKIHNEVLAKMRLENPERWENYERDETYRDIEYVKAEVTQLAKQLKEIK